MWAPEFSATIHRRAAVGAARYPATMPPAAPTAPSVQVFGLDSDNATRAAIRFFKERRVAIHQVDLRRKPIEVTAGRAEATWKLWLSKAKTEGHR